MSVFKFKKNTRNGMKSINNKFIRRSMSLSISASNNSEDSDEIDLNDFYEN